MSCPPLTASESAPKVSGTKTTPQSSSPSRPSMIMGPPPNPPADAPTSSRSSSSPGSTPRLQHGWFASPGSSSTINIASMTRPRGSSTSTVRTAATTPAPGTLLVTHAQPMNRIISNPLPAVASVTFPTVPSTVSYAGAVNISRPRSRERAFSLSSRGRSRDSDGVGRGRSKSPLRDLAKSWSAFGRRKLGGSKSGSQTPASLDQSQASGDTSRPDTRDGERRGAEEVDNTVAWWHVPSSPKNRTERKDTIPIEVTETVRERVLQATAHLLPPNASHIAREALDTAVEVTHEALSIAADVLEFAPVAGLSEAARVLLGIWEAVQQVDLNKMVCLRLTERCATMLISIREEIAEADGLISRSPPSRLLGSPGHNGSPGNRQGSPGLQHQSPKLLEASSEEKEHDTPRMSDSQRSLPGETVSASGWNAVGDELRAPLERLVAAFNQVLTFLEKQNRRPFLKRYLKRDEIQNQLTACDAALNDALGMFGLSIQIRILKQVLRADEQRQADTVKMMDAILHTPPFAFASPSLPPYPEGDILLEELSPTAAGSSQLNALDLNISPIQSSIQATLHTSIQPDNLSPSEVINTITRINTLQNNHDFARDTAELRQLLKNALSTNDDLEMIKVLQVSREEMPEAIKALQRALEAEIGKERDEREMSAIGEDGESDRQLSDSSGVSVGSMQGIVDGVLGGKVSDPETHEADASLSRRNTLDSSHTRTSSKSQDSHTTSASRSGASHDTLDREFIESGIETLLRLSIRAGKPPSSLSLPPWTITRYEVDRDVQIGMGFFSSVWRGTYKGRTVAVKILAPWTPRDTFQREVMVWRKLRHRNVLELIGASAVEADGSFGLQQDGFMAAEWNDGNEGGPWFFVSRYYERGSLVKWVKGLGKDVWDQLLDDVEKGVLRMIHEVARGMSYLHTQGVLHGDLKCANVLVDDQGHCIISDFGQSEMKSEAYRLSGTPLPHGTLRWQAPELMTGQGELTQQIDIYAFAVSCVEILAKGGVPWHLVDDATVRHLVLIDNIRPELPNLRPWSGQLGDCIQRCWDRVPSSRPPFTQIDTEISNLRRQYGWTGIEIIEDAEAHQQKEWVQWLDGVVRTKKSPNMNPRPLPNLPPDMTFIDTPSFSNEEESFVTANDSFGSDPSSRSERSQHTQHGLPPLQTSTSAPVQSTHPAPELVGRTGYSAPGDVQPPPSVTALPPQSSHASSRASSLYLDSLDGRSDIFSDVPEALSPLPANEAVSEIRNERRYRMLLQHEFHPSLTLPLWSPSPVQIGAVGYHAKPSGSFVTLLNAFRPMESSGGVARDMPSLLGFGQISQSCQKLDKRNLAQRSMDYIQGWISRGKTDAVFDRTVSRRYSSPLRNGHKTAHLFTESTVYNYISELDTAKKWFHANVLQLVELYGQNHSIQKEDLRLVIGTLDAADYALFVSHNHPDGQVNFNVFTSSKVGQPWGQFSTTNDLSSSVLGGPIYHEEPPGALSASKVSRLKKSSDPWDTLLLAKLRFPPDKDEPTSL